MATAKKKVREEPTTLQEVKTLREVPRVPEHCGKPMGKHIVGVGVGKATYRYKCNTCEAEVQGERVE